MDALLGLKRPLPVSLNLCIVCQESKNDKVPAATERGLKTLSDVTHERQKLRHVKYKDAVDRLSEALKHDSKSQLVWHKSCYAMYTNRTRLDKLKAASLAESSPSCSSASRIETQSSSHCRRRSSSKPINWALCMFCQKRQGQAKVDFSHNPQQEH